MKINMQVNVTYLENCLEITNLPPEVCLSFFALIFELVCVIIFFVDALSTEINSSNLCILDQDWERSKAKKERKGKEKKEKTILLAAKSTSPASYLSLRFRYLSVFRLSSQITRNIRHCFSLWLSWFIFLGQKKRRNMKCLRKFFMFCGCFSWRQEKINKNKRKNNYETLTKAFWQKQSMEKIHHRPNRETEEHRK